MSGWAARGSGLGVAGFGTTAIGTGRRIHTGTAGTGATGDSSALAGKCKPHDFFDAVPIQVLFVPPWWCFAVVLVFPRLMESPDGIFF
jgi:hypothetical protein